MKGQCACEATGLSSHAIAKAMGHCMSGAYDHPWDPSDLGRCLDYCAELHISDHELREVMRHVSPQWDRLTAEWSELRDLYWHERAEGTGRGPRTYAAMKRILRIT